jgi:hypothetical protein
MEQEKKPEEAPKTKEDVSDAAIGGLVLGGLLGLFLGVLITKSRK